MSRLNWPLRQYHQGLLQQEQGTVIKEPGGRLSVVALYPNTYQVGMANLGLAVLYRLINQRPDALCERAFLPDRASRPLYEKSGSPLLSLESSRPLDQFDLVLVSLCFENDAPNLAAMLDQGGLGALAAGRTGPLVVAGGVVPMLNPEPLADMVDACLLGEAEVVLEPFLEALLEQGDRPRPELLANLARRVRGLYVPSLYQAAFLPDGRLEYLRPTAGAPERVAAPKYQGPAGGLAASALASPRAQFGNMTLLEVGRGCGHACRFCAAGHLFRPPRLGRGPDFLAPALQAAGQGAQVGLVSAAVSDIEQVDQLAERVLAAGGRLGVSSLRADCLQPGLLEALAASGQQTVALAPEAGSQRLRQVINKHLDEEQLARAVEQVLTAGIPNLRLYFMVGLPGEQPEDIEEMIGLIKRLRQQVVSLSRPRARLGTVTVSLSPFVPKPWTPFQWEPMAPLKTIKARLALIKKRLAPLANLKVNSEVAKYARLQAVISRGDRRLGPLLRALAGTPRPERAYAQVGLDPEFYANRRREKEEVLPWSVVDHGVQTGYLWEEAQRARRELASPVCEPQTCRRCGACGETLGQEA